MEISEEGRGREERRENITGATKTCLKMPTAERGRAFLFIYFKIDYNTREH